MKRSVFKYDSRLNDDQLRTFQKLVGNSISFIHVENITIALPPPQIDFSNSGRCFIRYYSKRNGNSGIIELSSTFHETPPIVDSGGFTIMTIEKSEIPSKTTTICYTEQSPIETIRFFGYRERRNLEEIFPDYELNDLHQYGFTTFPRIEVDTLEFFIIEHKCGKKTIVSSNYGGFSFNFLTEKSIDARLLYDSYIKVNGYEKKIILQHELTN